MIMNRFFLHIFPRDAADLSAASAKYGYDNADFDFPESGFYDGEAYLSIPLPSYDVDHIEIGQFTDGGRIWEALIKL